MGSDFMRFRCLSYARPQYPKLSPFPVLVRPISPRSSSYTTSHSETTQSMSVSFVLSLIPPIFPSSRLTDGRICTWLLEMAKAWAYSSFVGSNTSPSADPLLTERALRREVLGGVSEGGGYDGWGSCTKSVTFRMVDAEGAWELGRGRRGELGVWHVETWDVVGKTRFGAQL